MTAPRPFRQLPSGKSSINTFQIRGKLSTGSIGRQSPLPVYGRLAHRCVAAAASSSSSDADVPVEASGDVTPKKGMSSLTKRAIFGTILGLAGAGVILTGGVIYALVTCLVAYQASQEFIGLVNAKGISAGMKPPPPIIGSAISLLCVTLNAWAYISGGKTASAMAVATFLVLSLQLLAVAKPRFSQLTSSVFGLLYCGYLPSFWIKLRLLAIPAVNSVAATNWLVRLTCHQILVLYLVLIHTPANPSFLLHCSQAWASVRLAPL